MKRLILFRFSTFLLLCNILNNNLNAGTAYFVAKSGSNSSAGSINQPWLTIQHAAEMMTAGDTVFIKSGMYYETVAPQNSGNMDNYINLPALQSLGWHNLDGYRLDYLLRLSA